MSAEFLDQTGVLFPVPVEGDSSWSRPLRELCETKTNDPAAALLANPSLPYLGSRYQLVSKLGQGAMGAVYLAEDLSSGDRVAIKVLPPELMPDQQAVQRFQKESRLLAEVRHPHVANLIDVGSHDKTCFLVMELVEGTDLKSVLERHGALPERLALQIIGDIASALAAAHERGIVHRDLKPANILLSAIAESGESPAEAVHAAVAAGQPPTAKLTDFGLARHVDQAASMDLTKTGMMLGTPYYISPEQCTDKGKITPAADVYSLGATLFELLTGRPPFKTDDPIKLISMHCFEQAPDPRKLNPEISDGVAALIAKALQKSAAGRFADAGHLLSELNRLLRGEATSAAIHPSLPKQTGKVFEANWEWDLDGNPADLWQWVSNTERVNAAVGLPPVEYVTRRDDQGIKHRIGSFRLGWTRLRWEEHPFEWVEGRRLGVLRQFENGPFEWFVSVVELTPRPEGGSKLTHSVKIATRGWLGRLIAHLEVNIKGRKPLDKIYRRINDVVNGRMSGSAATDPFVPPPAVPASLHKKLAAIREKLAGQIPNSDVLDGLLEFLAESPAQELARIRPRSLARRLKLDADQLTTVCLAGCHAGLLELHWDILCPTCKVAADVKDTLSSIDKHAHCEACENNFDVDFSSTVELIFRVHPEIRQADLRTYCIGGPEHAPHVVAQTRLAPGEVFELDLTLDPGSYVLRGPQLPYTIGIVAEAASGASRLMVNLNDQPKSNRPVRIHAGRHLLTLTNEYSHSLIVRLERTITRNETITAAEAMRLPVFQQLFPSETISRDRLSNLSTCTLLGLRISNELDLFVTLGDAATCHRVRQVLETCRLTIETHGGKLVKESDDRILAAFPQATSALRTALELHTLVGTGVVENEPRVQLAMHRGMAMSTSINGRLDYFGRAVSLANRLLDSSDARFVVSQEIAQDDDCRELLAEAHHTLRQLTHHGELSTYKVCGNERANSMPHNSNYEPSPNDSTAVLASAGQEHVEKVSL